jgi:hypothetical protein
LHGFTFDEADDANEYALQYMQDVVRDTTAPPGIVSFVEGAIQQARGIPVHHPWPLGSTPIPISKDRRKEENGL